MTVALRVLVLPAFDDLDTVPSEADPWHRAHDLDRTTRVDGLPRPLVHDGDGRVGLVPTGIGKTAAATTTAALCAGDAVRLDDALVLSVGVAGGPPRLPIGSVVIADRLLDWDDKCRFDPDDEPPVATNPYTGSSGVFEVDPGLVADATALAEGVSLATTEDGGDPVVAGGTNVCADELWHGRAVAERVSRFVEERGCPPYSATEMEDVGTATALRRFGLGDRYLSVRGIANHDRPDAGTPAPASFRESGFEAGFDVGLSNAVRVGRAIVDDRVD